jgi:hypothetical protein
VIPEDLRSDSWALMMFRYGHNAPSVYADPSGMSASPVDQAPWHALDTLVKVRAPVIAVLLALVVLASGITGIDVAAPIPGVGAGPAQVDTGDRAGDRASILGPSSAARRPGPPPTRAP